MRFPFLTALIAPLERLLRVDMRYALSGGTFLAASQGVSAVGALALTIAFANLLPVETYGSYRYVLAIYGLLAIFALPGIETAVLQSVSNGFGGALRTGVVTKLKFGLLGALASFTYAGYLYYEGSYIMAHLFILTGIALPLMESFSLYTSYLNGKKLFRTWALLDIAIQAVSIAALVGTVIITKNIIALLVSYFAPYILLRMLSTWWILRTKAREEPDDPGLLAYGKSMTVFQVIARVMASLDQIVLYHFLGPTQVAIFALATAVPNRIQSVFRISGVLAFPKFAQRTGEEIAASLPRKMALFALSIFGICILYVLLAPYLFTYIFPKYLPSLPFSQAAVFFTLSAIMYPFSSYLLAHKKLKENYILTIISFITKVLCLVGLVPFFGIWGAVIGLLATAAVSMLSSFVLIYRERSSSPQSQTTSHSDSLTEASKDI